MCQGTPGYTYHALTKQYSSTTLHTHARSDHAVHGNTAIHIRARPDHAVHTLHSQCNAWDPCICKARPYHLLIESNAAFPTREAHLRAFPSEFKALHSPNSCIRSERLKSALPPKGRRHNCWWCVIAIYLSIYLYDDVYNINGAQAQGHPSGADLQQHKGFVLQQSRSGCAYKW